MVRVNFRLLFRLVVLAVAFGGGLYGLYAYQSERIPEAMLWHANAAAELGKTDDAMRHMRRYLELRPTDYDQTIKLADLMESRAAGVKDLTNALYLYEKVMREAPDRHDASKKFVRACLRLNRSADGLRVADELLTAIPRDGELLGYTGECLMAQNKFPEARKKFEEALKQSPDNVRAFEQYARLLTFKMNQPKDALAVLDQLVKTNEASAESHLLRARALHLDRNDDAAAKDLDRVFWLDPENVEAMLLSAEIEQMRGDTRRARETLLAALDTSPRDVRGYRALSWLNLLSGNPTEAMQTLERGLTKLPDAPDLLTPLGDLCLEQGDTDKAADIIKKLDAKPAAAAQGKYLRARLLMKQGKFKDAIAVLEPLRAEVLALAGVEQQVSLMLAGCHERCGDFAAQREVLKRLLGKEPGNLPARVAMANMFLNAGQFPEAGREYDLAAKSPIAGAGVRVMAAKLRLSRLKAEPKTKPDEWAELEGAARELIRQQPNSIEPVALLADVQAAHGEAEKGTETLHAACRLRPSDPRLWVALADFAWREDGTVKAVQILNEARAVAGDTVEWKLARAKVIARMNPVVDVDRLAGATSHLSETERVRLWKGLVDILTLETDDAKATLAACRTLADLSSQDIASRRRMYLAAVHDKDAAAERQRGKELQAAHPNGETFVKVVRAGQETRAAAIPEARLNELKTLADQTVRDIPELVEAHWLAARVADRMNDSPAAAKSYGTAAQMDPLNTQLLADRMRFIAKPNDQTVTESAWMHLAADPRIGSGRLLAAKRLAGRNTNLPRNANTDYWAGQFTQPGQTLDAAQGAISECDLALGREKLIPLLAFLRADLKRQHPQWKPDIQTSEEYRVFTSACVAHDEFVGRPADALPVLTALAADKNAKPEDVAWAKQAEAAIRLQLGDAEGGKVAQADLKKWLDSEPATVAEHRNRVSVLSAALRTANGVEKEPILSALLQSLGEITKGSVATVADWYQLSQLYRGVGDRTNARRCLGELLKREPNNLQYLAINVDDLISDGRLADAEPMVASLQPGVHDLRVAGVLAKYLALVNDAPGVLETTDKFVKAADAGTADGAIRQRQAAELLDQLARLSLARNLSGGKLLLEGACERYRAVSHQYPEAVGAWAALLALGGQPEKAFEELEKRQQRMSAADLAVGGMRVLQAGSPTPKQFQTVNGWLAKALAEQPKSVALHLRQAEWHTLQSQYDAAGKAYRRVLELDGNQPVALNNLAWILAADPATAAEALQLADKAVRQSAANAELLDTRARILISAGQFAEAKRSLEEALNASQTGLRYFHMALWHLKQDQRADAVRMFREALNRGLDPKAVHPADAAAYRELLAAVK